jgi:hypothetical protein
VQTFGMSLRGVENAIVTPVSIFSPPFSTLHKLTRVASVTLFCAFERGIDTHLRFSFHEFVHIINYFTLITPVYPLPALKRYFQAVTNVLTKDNTLAAR